MALRALLLPIPMVLMPALLVACASAPPPTGVQTIRITATANANQNNATALDLVFVYDSNAVALLPKGGPDWFAGKAALVAGLATSIDVVSLQIPPVSIVNLPADRAFPARYQKAIGVYGYANYVAAAGQPMFNLTPYGTVGITLAPDAVVLKGAPPRGVFGKLMGLFSGKSADQ
jgi:type VI secretion system protein